MTKIAANTRMLLWKNPEATALPGVFLCACMFIALGCEGPARQPASEPATAVPEGVAAQAVQIVTDALSDPDPEMRARAVEVVATTKQVRMMPRVQRLLKDPVVPVRFLAALTVGDLQYTLAKNDAVQLLKDQDENVRIAAAYAMMKLGSAEYFKVLCNAVASQDQTVRANAAFLLGKTGRKEAAKYLYWALREKSSADKVVLQSVESLATLGDEQMYPKLWSRLISAYADDRVVGIRGMGALATEQARNALLTMLNDGVLEVRLVAAEQLGKLRDHAGEAEVVGVFRRSLTANMDPESRERVKAIAAMAIGAIATDNLVKLLPQLIKDESRLVRIAAAKAVLQATAAK